MAVTVPANAVAGREHDHRRDDQKAEHARVNGPRRTMSRRNVAHADKTGPDAVRRFHASHVPQRVRGRLHRRPALRRSHHGGVRRGAVRAPLRDRPRRRMAHAARGGPRREGTVVLEGDGEGHWRVNGVTVAALDGCTDVDLEASAVTNAFPVARGATDAPAAWVRFDLSVERLEQTYAATGNAPTTTSARASTSAPRSSTATTAWWSSIRGSPPGWCPRASRSATPARCDPIA